MEMYPLIEITSSKPFDRGVQYGEQARERINVCVDHYRERFTKSGQEWEAVKDYSMRLAVLAEKYTPETLDEARGIAAGSGKSIEEIMVVNCRYEVSKFPKMSECTTAAILPEASADGKTYLLKNWDYSEEIIPHVVLLRVKTAEGLGAFGITEAGQVVRDGFNAHGVAFVNNNLQSIHDHLGTGLPATFIRKRLLESETFEAACDFLVKAERAVSCNTMIAHSQGVAANFEAYPGGADVIKPIDGILVHANHFVVNPALDALKDRPRNRDSRLYELLSAKRGAITPQYMMECLCDHEYYPLSICGHTNERGDEYSKHRCTVSSMIMNLTDGIAYVCAGLPCQGQYVKFSL